MAVSLAQKSYRLNPGLVWRWGRGGQDFWQQLCERAGRLVLNLGVVYNVISSASLHVVFDHLGSILKAKKAVSSLRQ